MNIKLLKIEESLEKIKILNFEQYFQLKVCDMEALFQRAIEREKVL